MSKVNPIGTPIAKLVTVNPVPSDIDVSQSIPLVNISEVAESIGILPTEYDMYGSTKAKVPTLIHLFIHRTAVTLLSYRRFHPLF